MFPGPIFETAENFKRRMIPSQMWIVTVLRSPDLFIVFILSCQLMMSRQFCHNNLDEVEAKLVGESGPKVMQWRVRLSVSINTG